VGAGRVVNAVPHGHWKITTFLAGLGSPSAPSPTGTDRRCVTADFVHCRSGAAGTTAFNAAI